MALESRVCLMSNKIFLFQTQAFIDLFKTDLYKFPQPLWTRLLLNSGFYQDHTHFNQEITEIVLTQYLCCPQRNLSGKWQTPEAEVLHGLKCHLN